MTDQYLDVKSVAALLEVDPGTIHTYRSRGTTPPFPEPDIVLGHSPGWRHDTIAAWRALRPGQGKGGGRPPKEKPGE